MHPRHQRTCCSSHVNLWSASRLQSRDTACAGGFSLDGLFIVQADYWSLLALVAGRLSVWLFKLRVGPCVSRPSQSFSHPDSPALRIYAACAGSRRNRLAQICPRIRATVDFAV